VKFLCERDALAFALQAASRALSSAKAGTTFGVRWTLSNGQLTIEGAERDLAIRSSLSVMGADVSFQTPASLTLDLVRSMAPGQIEVAVEDTAVTLRSGRAEFSLNLLDIITPPSIGAGTVTSVRVPAGALAQGIHHVAVAASNDEGRDVIYSSMLFSSNPQGLRLVATDGIRLALQDIPNLSVSGNDARDVVVPARAVRELERLVTTSGVEEIGVGIGERDAVFELGSTTLATRLVMEPFRDYQRLIDAEYSKTLLVDRLSMVDALRRLRRMARESRNNSSVQMTMTSTTCELSVSIPSVGQVHEVLDANFNNAEFTIHFDPDMLADGVENVDGDVIKFEFSEPNRAACLSAMDSDEYLYLVMPIIVR
jgi:DNA polymerase-3 subunit beta